MNKELDERLIPNGEYIDALNIGVNSTEEDESGVVENSLGNIQVTALAYNGTSLSNNALCIGALEDGSNETLYWFVHDPAFTASAATGKLDLIVSYNTELALITYHVVSINDGGGVNTTLNFNPSYLITGVNKVDDFLFFTDDYNAPRFINVTKTYTVPTAVDGFTAEELLVIKKPPTEAPTLSLSFSGSITSNFLEDRYICFAYRYRYDDNMYSATSQFTKPAFSPKVFEFSTESYLNGGMENEKNQASVTFNTGGPLVKGIDLLFKEAGNSTIKVIEKLDKANLGIEDNQSYNINFNNSKIFTLLPESEILRLYDNVPRLSKAQTIMGNRLMFGNYLEGYPLTSLNGEPTELDYNVSLLRTDFDVEDISPVIRSSEDYTINPIASPTAVPNARITFDLTSIATDADGNSKLVIGAEIEFVFTFEHHSFNVDPALTPEPAQTNFPSSDPFEFTATFVLSQNYESVFDFATSTEFLNGIGTATSIKPLYDPVGETSCDGNTITDQYNCAAAQTLGIYSIYTSGITSASTAANPEPIKITAAGGDQIRFQFPAFHYVDVQALPTVNIYEYITCTAASASFIKAGNSESLHSNRGYEIGMIYMDEYSRSTNALVSSNNSLYVPCGNSDNKNKIQVTIPTNQLAPSWATRYKFAIKPDREGYDTIYSNLFFVKGAEAYVLLEGENARKVNEGDRLIVKRDGAGATSSCVYVTVLEKLTLSSSEAEAETLNENAPSGVYIKIDGSDVDFTTAPNTFINYNSIECIAKNSDKYAALWQPMNLFAGGTGQDFTVPAGSIIKFKFEFEREGRTETSSCEKRHYTIDKTFQSTQDYDNMYEWFIGDNIEGALNQGVQDQAAENNPPTFVMPSVGVGGPIWGSDGIEYCYISSAENVESQVGILPSVTQYGFKWHRNGGVAPQGRLYLAMTSTRACGIAKKRWARVKSKVTVTRSLNLMVFETIPQDASPDLFYESSASYAIDTATGYHYGNAGNQSATDPAIVNTEFFNCYSFGNGVESYKIRDSIEGKTFSLGNRATSTQGKDYEQVRRFADITYSGVYNQESNVNKLNEFNLGLLNFKPLEQSYGNIEKLHAIQTDVLCLQEDKVSFVLAGKNLLSDAVGGGAVTSVPEVLGQQIARSEDFGISNNPESFAEFGPYIFFTDAKRGAVIQLLGSTAANMGLSVISDAGMSTWFRDLFQVSFDYQKLGGYDPYSEEYVLSPTTRKLPTETSCIPCGSIQTYVISSGETVTYCVDVGGISENFDIDYTFISAGTANIQAVYDGGTTATGNVSVNGTLTVTKTSSKPTTADISLTAVGGDVTLEVLVKCPVGNALTVVQVAVTSKPEEGQLIHNQYKFSQGGYTSPVQSNQVQFLNTSTPPVVSQFSFQTGFQGEGAFPSDGSTVSVISNKLGDDSYVWDANDKLLWLRSNFAYTTANVNALIATAISAGNDITPVGAASPTVTGTFTMPAGTDSYLYLIYDYRDNLTLKLCYWAAKPSDCCCTTASKGTYYLDSSSFSTATGIYTNATLTTQAVDGWYSDGVVLREQVSGVLQPSAICGLCSVECGSPAINGTALKKGKYKANFDLGVATGAVIVKYTPNMIPNGIRATYNGTNYNKLTSPVYGKLQSSVPSNNFTVCGGTSSSCTGIISTSTFLKYEYNDATSVWDYQNSSESITIGAGDLELQPLSAGQCIMVIPKPAASPDTLTINIAAVCGPADFSLAVDCPAAIPATLTSALSVTGGAGVAPNACGLPTGSTNHYFVHADGTTGGAPQLHSYVFTDANGATAAADGWISYSVGPSWWQIQDGIIISTGAC